MLFDPPDVVGQLRISRVDFDHLRRVQYLFEPGQPDVPFRDHVFRVSAQIDASSKDRTKDAALRDEILGNPLRSVFG